MLCPVIQGPGLPCVCPGAYPDSRCTIFRCCLDVRQVALQVWKQQVCLLQVCQQQLLVCLLVWACQRKESKRMFHFYTGFTCWIAGAPGSQQKEWQRQPAQCTVIMVGLVWYEPRGEAASCLWVCGGVKLRPRLGLLFIPNWHPVHPVQASNAKRMRYRLSLGFPVHDLL